MAEAVIMLGIAPSAVPLSLVQKLYVFLGGDDLAGALHDL